MFPGLWMILPEPKWRHRYQLPYELCIQLIRTLHSSAICYYSLWLCMFIPTDHEEWNVLSHYTQRIGSIHNPYSLLQVVHLYHEAIMDVFSYYHIALYTMRFLFFLHCLAQNFPHQLSITNMHVYTSDGSSIISQCKSIFDLCQYFD